MLGTHDVVGAAVGLARDHGHLGHGRLGEGEEQLRPVLDQAAVLLRGAGQETRHVDEGHDRDLEAVAEAHEAGGLTRGVAVEHARQHHRLVRHDADGAAFHAREARDDVLRVGLLDLEEVALVDDLQDQLFHVVGLVWIVGDQRVERRLGALRTVGGGKLGHARLVVGGQEVHEAAHLQQRLDIVLVGAVGDRGLGGVHAGAAQFFRRDGLVGHRLHHVRASDEHVARVLHHEDEVGHGG